MNYSRADYDYMAGARRRAFQRIAGKLGKDHPVTKMMGGLSHGRHRAEQGPDGNLRTAVREMSFLDGYFDCLNLWARDNDPAAQRIMIDEYPHGYEKA